MVNFLETDALSECPFTNAQRVTENGTFDGETTQQVKSVQSWLNCYNKQEGATAPLTANGVVAPATWSQVCNYAYRFPKQSRSNTSPYAADSITAGKAAGCDSLS